MFITIFLNRRSCLTPEQNGPISLAPVIAAWISDKFQLPVLLFLPCLPFTPQWKVSL